MWNKIIYFIKLRKIIQMIPMMNKSKSKLTPMMIYIQKKKIKIKDAVILIRLVINESNKCYRQVYLEESLYKFSYINLLKIKNVIQRYIEF